MKVFFFSEWVKGAVGIEKSTQSFSFVKVFFFCAFWSILEKEDEKKLQILPNSSSFVLLRWYSRFYIVGVIFILFFYKNKKISFKKLRWRIIVLCFRCRCNVIWKCFSYVRGIFFFCLNILPWREKRT